MRKNKILIFLVTVIAIAVVALSGVTIYNKIIKPKKYDEYIELGNQYLSEQNYDEAISYFEKAIEIDDESIEARLGAAKGYVGVKDLKNAEKKLLQAQKLNIKDEELTLEILDIIVDSDKQIANKIVQNFLDEVGTDNISEKFRSEVTESTDKNKLNTYIKNAQNLHDNAVEGSEDGQYKQGSKDELLSVIESAKKINNDYFVTQKEVDTMANKLDKAMETFKSNKIKLMPENLASNYLNRLKAVEDSTERKLSDETLCNADMGNIVYDSQLQYEAILDDIYADLNKYLPDSDKAKVAAHKKKYESDKADKEYEFENIDPMMVGTWMVTGVPEAFAELAKDNCYDLIYTYMQ